MPAPEEVSEQLQVGSEADPTPAVTVESDPPTNDSVPEENLSDLSHTRTAGTSSSDPMPNRTQTDSERPIPETSVGPAV